MSQQFQPPAPGSATPAAVPDPAGPSRRANLGLGIAAAVVAALAAAAAYGGIMNAVDRQIGYAAVGVGILIGLAAGRVGGRNPVLPVISAVLAVGSVYLGQLFFVALALADYAQLGLADVLADPGIGAVVDLWKEGAEAMDYVFLLIGAVVAFGAAKRSRD
ncbi:hypothetical protein ACFV7Q_13980 [Streptomyces sp. NPDC059851]|uniref:hypothetical protein n=1 Tax=Streptomyces sp. NPDC059851 TaxID=3346971 RepID=UPI003667ECBD